MKIRPIALKLFLFPVFLFSVLTLTLFQVHSEVSPSGQAKTILEKSGIKGGLIVHLHCGNGMLTQALRVNDSFLVQGLDKKEENVQKARKYILSKQKYGPVSVDRLMSNYLPYKDNLVNLIVAEDLGSISKKEAMRVLTPNGVLMTRSFFGRWKKAIKKKPTNMDEWNQFLYNASGNPVSNDETIGPIRNYQWIGSPRWGRHHDTTASMSALVSANGRIFYIIDEGPTESIELPAENYLVARDAFNGTILWKKPITKWFDHLFSLKSGPAYLPRRLIAANDSVYVTLDIDAPLSELDAATGEVIRTFPNTKETSEVILLDNTLYTVVGRPEKTKTPYTPQKTYVWENADLARSDYAWGQEPAQIMAINRSTGDAIWKTESPIAPLSLTADSRSVYYYDGSKLISLDRENGKQKWQSEKIVTKKIDTSYAPRVVVSEDVLLFSTGAIGFGQPGRIIALSTDDGKKIWEAPQPGSGHYSLEDVFVINGVVWAGRTANVQDDGTYYGRDLHTGKMVEEIPGYKAKYWFHQRCYPSKATKNFIIPSRTGIEFVDLKGEYWDINHYVRGGCFYGIMPSNGLIYAPPHACACYMEAKLNGFGALGTISNIGPDPGISSQNRLEKGPAYNRKISAGMGQEDWPTYRHDTKRSAYTKTSVSSDVKSKWNIKLGGKLSSPVVAGNRVYISRVDSHTIYSIDTTEGDIIWNYTVGARVDSPPTIYKGRVFFGSTDGYVYCLDAADGALIWRFRAAPRDMRMVAFEQVESVWPVHG
ncbi:MAG: PQQ-binding-like beta-propeller repeat protein, partial [Desulfobacteraceae bacterium]